MAERVGLRGSVFGIDLDAALGAEAIVRLHAVGWRQCVFAAIDVQADANVPGAPFDLVFARLLLLHVDDPVAVLRRLWGWVAPGGRLVIQDYDLAYGGETVPPLELMDEFRRVLLDTFRAAGHDLRTGPRLPSLHEQAGVGAPDGIDAALRLAPLPELAPRLANVYESLLPAATRLGVTTRARGEQWLEAFARQSAGAGSHVALWPPLVATWKRRRPV
jgi:SAM-dependent methyltransferase